MSGMHSTTRRGFLKAGTAGAAGLAVAGVASSSKAGGAAWSDGMEINSQIDNLRVVTCRDPDMCLLDYGDIGSFGNMTNQNAAADTGVIQANMDEMAMALAQESTPSAAWAKIFQEPSAGYANARVAIKVNGISENHPRVAVVDKVCRVLHSLNVPYGNITLYDGCHGASQHYSSFVGASSDPSLPSGVLVSNYNSLMGGEVSAPVPGEGNHDCTADIANGNVDILVNCAVNKGHSSWNGNCTLTMKNHYGTFSPDNHSSMSYIEGINKSDAIVGGTPTRQQLCIIDSLWGMTYGPGGTPNHNTYRLIMGTFGPAVDYLTVMKVREDEMSVGHNGSVDGFITAFGYTTGERDNLLTLTPEQNSGKGWVEVTPASQVRSVSRRSPVGASHMSVTLTRRGYHTSAARFAVPGGVDEFRVSIMDARGRVVRNMTARGSVHWDAADNAGRTVPRGAYVVRIQGRGFDSAQSLTVK